MFIMMVRKLNAILRLETLLSKTLRINFLFVVTTLYYYILVKINQLNEAFVLIFSDKERQNNCKIIIIKMLNYSI